MKELFKDYCKLYDLWMKIRGKQPRPKIIKYIFFVPFLLCIGFLIAMIAMSKDRNRYSYRTSPNYKKVIKEGIFFDTVEYHEK